MDDGFQEMFDRYLKPEDAEEESEEFHAPSGIRETITPYERLRRELKRIFPKYPDVFDYSAQQDDDD